MIWLYTCRCSQWLFIMMISQKPKKPLTSSWPQHWQGHQNPLISVGPVLTCLPQPLGLPFWRVTTLMACFSSPTPPNLRLGQESSLQLQRNLWWELFVKIVFYCDIKIISFQYSLQLTFMKNAVGFIYPLH